MDQNRWTRILVLPAAVMLCVAAARPACASGLDWKISSSLNYETGKYGTDTRSSSLYVPFTVKRYWGDGYASLTLPFVSLTSDGSVTNVGGRPVRVRGGGGAAAAATTTQSGAGDAVLRGGWDALREDPNPFDLTVVGKIKAPTADKDKGLGTGEFDEGLGLEFGKLLLPGWTLIADLYYTVIGDPPGRNLNNQVAVDAGFSHPLRKDLTLTVLLEGSNALVSGEPGPRDLRGILDYKLGEQGSLFGGGLVGLSRGSPDFGFTFGGGFRFN
ncbi:MAG: transporter [Elusimicrobia bacterium]|nr:transporter [Elusimicrobiota bacterium]